MPLAAWMATEIWHEFGKDVPVTIIPVADERLEVYLDGEVIYDRIEEGRNYPDMRRVRAIRTSIRDRLASLPDN